MNLKNWKLSELFSQKGRKFSASIKKITGCSPRSVFLYEQALLHRSIQEKGPNGEIISNERLEFLGDAILGAVVSEMLFNHFPLANEGALTKMRSRIVNRSLLNQVALKMKIDNLIKSQPQIDLAQTHIVGDALEALIGAVFMDRGFVEARRFVLEGFIGPYINLAEIARKDSNYKSMLIEWGHKNKYEIEFHTDETHSGPDTPTVFHSKIYALHEMIGEGSASSKKEAQQKAARLALEYLQENNPLVIRDKKTPPPPDESNKEE